MNASILAIADNRTSSMGYLAALRAKGNHAKDVRTFEAAQVLLGIGENPEIIIIDVSLRSNEIAAFIQFVRREQNNRQAGIVVMGCENDILLAYGANACLDRPVNVDDLLAVLEPAL